MKNQAHGFIYNSAGNIPENVEEILRCPQRFIYFAMKADDMVPRISS